MKTFCCSTSLVSSVIVTPGEMIMFSKLGQETLDCTPDIFRRYQNDFSHCTAVQHRDIISSKTYMKLQKEKSCTTVINVAVLLAWAERIFVCQTYQMGRGLVKWCRSVDTHHFCIYYSLFKYWSLSIDYLWKIHIGFRLLALIVHVYILEYIYRSCLQVVN